MFKKKKILHNIKVYLSLLNLYFQMARKVLVIFFSPDWQAASHQLLKNIANITIQVPHHWLEVLV